MKQLKNISQLLNQTLKKGLKITNQNLQKSLKKVSNQVQKNINLPTVDKFPAEKLAELKITQKKGNIYVQHPENKKKMLVSGGKLFKKNFPGITYEVLRSELYRRGKGKYSDLSKEDFCGLPGTFPVKTKGQCRSSLVQARKADNPTKVINCIIHNSLKKGYKCGSASKQVKKILL